MMPLPLLRTGFGHNRPALMAHPGQDLAEAEAL
jgi:hypothetical protein